MGRVRRVHEKIGVCMRTEEQEFKVWMTLASLDQEKDHDCKLYFLLMELMPLALALTLAL